MTTVELSESDALRQYYAFRNDAARLRSVADLRENQAQTQLDFHAAQVARSAGVDVGSRWIDQRSSVTWQVVRLTGQLSSVSESEIVCKVVLQKLTKAGRPARGGSVNGKTRTAHLHELDHGTNVLADRPFRKKLRGAYKRDLSAQAD